MYDSIFGDSERHGHGDIPSPPPPEAVIDGAERTRSAAHLRALVIGSLEVLGSLDEETGPIFEFDPEGVLTIPTEPFSLRLMVDPSVPVIELSATLADGIRPSSAVGELICRPLSNPFVSLTLHEQTVRARLSLESTVFHIENFESALGNWAVFLREEAPALAEALAAYSTPHSDRVASAPPMPRAS
ncbi:hypothetical protein [Gordonia polyisoprenivorans]|uniref:hypothetical protein n=1 Tax=Gordonia polyisoprenivorans TaxID=84595 RepID=UPI0030D25946